MVYRKEEVRNGDKRENNLLMDRPNLYYLLVEKTITKPNRLPVHFPGHRSFLYLSFSLFSIVPLGGVHELSARSSSFSGGVAGRSLEGCTARVVQHRPRCSSCRAVVSLVFADVRNGVMSMRICLLYLLVLRRRLLYLWRSSGGRSRIQRKCTLHPPSSISSKVGFWFWESALPTLQRK